MNSPFTELFKGPGINQIPIPTTLGSQMVLRTHTEPNNDLMKVFIVVTLVGIGIFVGNKILKKKTMKNNNISRNEET